MTTTTPNVLRDENIAKLSKAVAKHVNRPRSVGYDDAQQDAAMILIEMRSRWDESKSAHLTPDKREAMVVSWARLRLIDKYEAEFARQAQTVPIPTMKIVNSDGRFVYNAEQAVDMVDPKSEQKEKRLSDLDRADIEMLIARLPADLRRVTMLLLYDGLTQHEAAKVLGVSQPAVCSAYKRAQDELRSSLRIYSEVIG